VEHHDLIMGWPEMAALRGAGDLAEALLFGAVTVAMRNWVGRMGVGDRARRMGEPRAGFLRDESGKDPVDCHRPVICSALR
jgi:hypothetical protein